MKKLSPNVGVLALALSVLGSLSAVGQNLVHYNFNNYDPNHGLVLADDTAPCVDSALTRVGYANSSSSQAICTVGWTTDSMPDYSMHLKFDIEIDSLVSGGSITGFDFLHYSTSSPNPTGPQNWEVRLLDSSGGLLATDSGLTSSSWTTEFASFGSGVSVIGGESYELQLTFYNATIAGGGGVFIDDANILGHVTCVA